jgi:hypothetical protein
MMHALNHFDHHSLSPEFQHHDCNKGSHWVKLTSKTTPAMIEKANAAGSSANTTTIADNSSARPLWRPMLPVKSWLFGNKHSTYRKKRHTRAVSAEICSKTP